MLHFDKGASQAFLPTGVNVDMQMKELMQKMSGLFFAQRNNDVPSDEASYETENGIWLLGKYCLRLLFKESLRPETKNYATNKLGSDRPDETSENPVPNVFNVLEIATLDRVGTEQQIIALKNATSDLLTTWVGISSRTPVRVISDWCSSGYKSNNFSDFLLKNLSARGVKRYSVMRVAELIKKAVLQYKEACIIAEAIPIEKKYMNGVRYYSTSFIKFSQRHHELTANILHGNLSGKQSHENDAGGEAATSSFCMRCSRELLL